MEWIAVTVSALFLLLMVPSCYLQWRKPPEARVREMMEVGKLAVALTSYHIEYNGYGRFAESPTAESKPLRSRGTLLTVLRGDISPANPKGIAFYEPPPERKPGKPRTVTDASGEKVVVDGHGNAYFLILDLDGDGLVPDPMHPGMQLEGRVLVWSAGKDGDPMTWKDNLTSWEEVAGKQ